MVKKGGKKVEYALGQIVLLAIPRKNRLSVEATRLPCRITKITRGAYTLLSQNGPLKGSYQGSSLVPVLTSETFGIPDQASPGAKAITLPIAVTLANNRKSILAQQKIGAKATRKRKRQVETSGQSEADRLAAQEAKAIAV
jgi:hypothetical protein